MDVDVFVYEVILQNLFKDMALEKGYFILGKMIINLGEIIYCISRVVFFRFIIILFGVEWFFFSVMFLSEFCRVVLCISILVFIFIVQIFEELQVFFIIIILRLGFGGFIILVGLICKNDVYL